MTLPNFLIVGAQKAGTTSLHEILAQHPQANMSTIKEVNYFTYAKSYDKGLGYYSSFFKQLNKNQFATGESSPSYMCFPGVAEKIKRDLGDIKIVMILRDPIKRAFSQYWDNRRHLGETMNEERIISNYMNDEYQPGNRGYFSRGIYIKYIKEYQRLFGFQNIHVILLEILIDNQTSELRRLYRFLGIDENLGLQKLPHPSNSSIIWKNPLYQFFFKRPEKSTLIPKKFRRFLFWGPTEPYPYKLPEDDLMEKVKLFYRPWNEELASHLNINLNRWIK